MKYLALAAALAAAHPAWADVAIAFGDCSAWGVGSGRFMSDAEHRAYEFCRQSGAGGCRIIARGRGECVYTVLQEGRVLFQHDGSNAALAGFDVKVTDHTGASSGPPQIVKVDVRG